MRSRRGRGPRRAVLVPSLANNTAPAEGLLASRSELSAFLKGVERRAFKQAVFAVREQEAALDIVQDAMLRLAEKYGDRPGAELPRLFHRIMQNAIRDWFRRQKVRSTWTTLFSALPGREDDEQDRHPEVGRRLQHAAALLGARPITEDRGLLWRQATGETTPPNDDRPCGKAP